MSTSRVLVCLLVLLYGLTCYNQVTAATLHFSTPTPQKHIMTRAAGEFSRLLEEASGGRYQVQVSPLNKFGDIPVVMSLLQTGAIQFAFVPAGDLARRDDTFYAWFLPYLFDDVADAGTAATSPAAREMLDRLRSHDLIGLGYVFPGQRHVLSRREIRSLQDLRRKKVRAFPNEIFEMWWKEVGAAPTALPLPEIAPSLITGVLDAVDVDLDIVMGQKYYKQAPCLGLSNHMSFPGVAVASAKWWASLTPSDRMLVRQTFASIQAWALAEQVTAEVNTLEKLRSEGVKVYHIPAAADAADHVITAFVDRHPLIRAFYEQNR